MSAATLLIISGLYTISALGFAKEGKYGMAMTFFCYAIANVGLVLAGRGL